MTDRFTVIPLADLLQIIMNQIDNSDFVLGVPKKLIFLPKPDDKFKMQRFGRLLETPVGVAAGPQTQLTQNIVTAWLTGARFIELKTIQTLDELEVSKPCIDMQDEGYNCEWSQELKIERSFDQYLNAWIIIHILRDKFGWTNDHGVGCIFNMSVGYNNEGIQNDNVQWFFNKMKNSSDELIRKIDSIKDIYPGVEFLEINPTISDNITLSTMHGCPSDEIEKIGEYLIEEKKLHTAIKLNPTLLGKEKLYEILANSGFKTDVPDIAFEHDLKFDEAVSIIKSLQNKADLNNLEFSVKLTNTLESVNNKEVFPEDEKMMYMSGRALHPISASLAGKLQDYFNGELDITFSGGVDSFNIVDVVKSGLTPATVCTDLLKPGGYGRLHQYIVELRKVDDFAESQKEQHKYLGKYLGQLSGNKAYLKSGFRDISIKTERALTQFDCIKAPCVETCPTNQSIPDYMYYTSKGDFGKAAEVILQTNPFPYSTGMVCDHLCQTKCTRINLDGSLLIREIKRFVSENSNVRTHIDKIKANINRKAAIIGAGPAGLSCAYFLALEGVDVTVYESGGKPGGMVSRAIPSFRLTDEAFQSDVDRIIELGVKVLYNQKVTKTEFEILRNTNDVVFIGTGAQLSKPLNIDGIDSEGVVDPLKFLFNVKENLPTGIGKNVIIIGGGNTAMDAARTAFRVVGMNGKVTVVYRRTIEQMPADTGEIQAVMDEGIGILELVSPVSVNSVDGKLVSLSCRKMKLGNKDESGRLSPVDIPGSDFELSADTIIPAIGQDLDIDFADTNMLRTSGNSYRTLIDNVYIGGDAMRGASTAINAIGDGRKTACEIIEASGLKHSGENIVREKQDRKSLMMKKSRREYAPEVSETELNDRHNFKLVSTTLNEKDAIKEASRCLFCDELCDICTTVCPNLAFHSFETELFSKRLPVVRVTEGKPEIVSATLFEIKQGNQILHIEDWCNQCGNCTTFCPTSGSPYREKPHLYLSRTEFDKNKDGFYVDLSNEKPVLYKYNNGILISYKVEDRHAILESGQCKMIFDSSSLNILDIQIKEKATFEVNVSMVALMKTVLQGAMSFLTGSSVKQ